VVSDLSKLKYDFIGTIVRKFDMVINMEISEISAKIRFISNHKTKKTVFMAKKK
jgi:hypothetical protein